MNQKYQEYKELLQKIADLAYSTAVLGWDQEVYMPPKGADMRARQLSTLSGTVHELFTANNTGILLQELLKDQSLTDMERRNVAETWHSYEDQKKYSTDFVMLMSRTVSEGFQAWDKAKKADNFSFFAPLLEKLVKLKRKECELLGYQEHPYDALLDQYERGSTTKQVETLFEEVKKYLVPMVREIATIPAPDVSFLYKHYDRQKQWDFGIELLKQMNFDFDAGRQDVSSHPFTTSFSSEDVRVTTRINENDLSEMIWSCIHEGGHALYEQGLRVNNYGLPAGEAVSLGIHESQSRLWENHVGRSLDYWKANFPRLQQVFPEQLKGVITEQFYHAVNTVKPSFVRTSADELTYHFHVIIRFEIEKALMEGSVNVMQLPALWNKKYKDYLGVDVTSDAKGVLQDIHWSHGSFGYFPTYSMGSFYAAQFYAKAQEKIPGLQDQIRKSDFKPLLDWLRVNIHQYGKLYTPAELCERVTGETLSFRYFLDYARKKYSTMYELNDHRISK